MAFLLERAGIALPAERMAEVAAEYESFRQQLALVNGAYAAQDELAARAAKLEIKPDRNFADIIRQYIADRANQR